MFVAFASWAVTSWVMLDAVPRANQAFREIVYGVMSARAENEIEPRIFFEDFPNRILYIGDAPSGGGWREVFLADTSKPEEPTVYHGVVRQAGDRSRASGPSISSCSDGSRHTAEPARPVEVRGLPLRRADSGTGPRHGVQLQRADEGRQRDDDSPSCGPHADELEKRHLPSHAPLIAMHRKFSIPAACLVFGVIGLALGASTAAAERWPASSRGSRVVFIYYVMLYLGSRWPRAS